MFVSKDYDKIPEWNKDATELDNFAYKLYLDEYLNNGSQILSQSLFMHLEQKHPNSVKFYRDAKLILRRLKIEKIKRKWKM